MTMLWPDENGNLIVISDSTYIRNLYLETRDEIKNYYLVCRKPEIWKSKEARKTEIYKRSNSLKNLLKDFQELRSINRQLNIDLFSCLIDGQIELLEQALSLIRIKNDL